jgi:hypothetical protein
MLQATAQVRPGLSRCWVSTPPVAQLLCTAFAILSVVIIRPLSLGLRPSLHANRACKAISKVQGDSIRLNGNQQQKKKKKLNLPSPRNTKEQFHAPNGSRVWTAQAFTCWVSNPLQALRCTGPRFKGPTERATKRPVTATRTQSRSRKCVNEELTATK